MRESHPPHIIPGSEVISIGGILNYIASRLPVSCYDIATTSGVNFILKHQPQIQDSMNSDAVLAVLPDSKEGALSLNEIAIAMGLDITSYTAMGRTKRQLSKNLRALIKWGWVDCDVRQNDNGNKAWYNIYWKTELATSNNRHY